MKNGYGDVKTDTFLTYRFTCLFHWSARAYCFIHMFLLIIYRRKFRSQISDNMDRWKSRDGKSQRREGKRREDQKIESLRGKKIQARKGRKVAKHCVFPMIWGSGGSKSTLAKAAGAEPAGQMRDEKLHAVVARSTFPSENAQNTSASEHF